MQGDQPVSGGGNLLARRPAWPGPPEPVMPCKLLNLLDIYVFAAF